MKNKHLYQFHSQLEAIKETVMYQLLWGRIQDFYKHNKLKINILIDKMGKLRGEYFDLDEKGNIKTEGEENNPIMLEGKTIDEYKNAYTILMETDCVIKF